MRQKNPGERSNSGVKGKNRRNVIHSVLTEYITMLGMEGYIKSGLFCL